MYNNHYNKQHKPLARSLCQQGILSEALLWLQLKGKKLKGYQFMRQRPIPDYIVDFFCPALKLIVEIDGASHYETQDDDERRDTRLTAAGYEILRITDRSVKRNMQGVLWMIEEKIEELERR